MSLLVVRNMLVEATGRRDLISTGIALGADLYINEAQRTLDRMLMGSKAGARYFIDLDASQVLVPLYNCRAIGKVFIGSAAERTELTRYDQHELRALYPTPYSGQATGIPTMFAPIWVRPYPIEVFAASMNQEWMLEDIIDHGSENFNALLLLPPPDVDTYTLEVWGLFYSDTLVNDTDVSYWTEEHPLLLVKTAMMHLEATYRNFEGYNDMKQAMADDMLEIQKDVVEEEPDVSEFGG